MKLSCEEVKELLSEYIDDMLSDDMKNAVKEHISVCESCFGEYSALRNVINELNELPSEPLPDGFKEKLHKRLLDEEKITVASLLARNWRKYSALAAGLILVMLIRTGYYDNINKFKTAYVDDAVLEGVTPPIAAREAVPPQQVQPGAESKTADNKKDTQTKAAPKTDGNISSQSNSDIKTGVRTEQVQPLPQEETPPITPQAAPTPQATPIPQPAPQEAPKEAVNPEQDAVMFSFRDDSMYSESSEEGGGAELRSGSVPDEQASAPKASAKAFAGTHDNEAPVFVSIIAAVDDFDIVSNILKEKNNAAVQDGSITLELDNDSFKEVMNILTDYGAEVTQEEPTQPLKTNKCVIKSK